MAPFWSRSGANHFPSSSSVDTSSTEQLPRKPYVPRHAASSFLATTTPRYTTTIPGPTPLSTKGQSNDTQIFTIPRINSTSTLDSQCSLDEKNPLRPGGGYSTFVDEQSTREERERGGTSKQANGGSRTGDLVRGLCEYIKPTWNGGR